jgi:hypothetical protein
MARRTAARMAAFNPAQSPPLVISPMRLAVIDFPCSKFLFREFYPGSFPSDTMDF